MSSKSRDFAKKTDFALNKVNVLFDKIKENSSLVFIVGAGVSMDEPTNTSSGKELCKQVKEPLKDNFGFNCSTDDLGELYDEFIEYRKEEVTSEVANKNFIDNIKNLYWDYFKYNKSHKLIVRLYHEGVIKKLFLDWKVR